MEDARAVLDCLLENARYETAAVARMTGLEEAAVEDALEDLEAAGVVRGYRPVVDWSATDEEHVLAIVECNVTLDRQTGYGDVAERLARFSSVQTVRLVSGEFDFLLEVEGHSMGDVAAFVAEEVAPVPAITQTVTHYAMTTYKEAGIAFGDDEDDRRSITP